MGPSLLCLLPFARSLFSIAFLAVLRQLLLELLASDLGSLRRWVVNQALDRVVRRAGLDQLLDPGKEDLVEEPAHLVGDLVIEGLPARHKIR